MKKAIFYVECETRALAIEIYRWLQEAFCVSSYSVFPVDCPRKKWELAEPGSSFGIRTDELDALMMYQTFRNYDFPFRGSCVDFWYVEIV